MITVRHADLRLDDRAAFARALDLPAGAADAELVRAGYARWGLGLAAAIHGDFGGDFAYVVRDEARGETHAARDAFGVKALAVPRAAGGSRALDPLTVLDYLEGGAYRDGSRTFLRDVERVLPGHVRVETRSGVTHHRFFEPPREVARVTREECDAEVLRLLRAAVAVRLDPRGTTVIHASGGLDSSAVACLADRLGARARIVSAAYPGLPCDEARYQDAVARAVSLPHERWDATAASPLEPFVLDAPFRPSPPDPSAGWRAIAAREGARVVLTGTGGDELFFERGYFRDLAARGRFLDLAREAHLSPRYSSRRRGAILRDALSVLVPPLVRRARARRRPAATPSPWLGPGLRAVWGEPPSPEPELSFTSHTQRWTWLWLTTPALSWRIEQEAALAARKDIEVRHPFLDARLARFVLSLAPDRRRPGGLMKRLLRSALHGVLPEAVRMRRGVTAFDSFVALQGRAVLARARSQFECGEWACEEWVDRAGIALGRGQVERGDATASRLALDVVNLEEWLRRRP